MLRPAVDWGHHLLSLDKINAGFYEEDIYR